METFTNYHFLVKPSRTEFATKIVPRFTAPSSIAVPIAAQKHQANKKNQLLCHRPSDAYGIPVTLCSEALAALHQDLHCVTPDMDKATIDFAQELSNAMANYYAT